VRIRLEFVDADLQEKQPQIVQRLEIAIEKLRQSSALKGCASMRPLQDPAVTSDIPSFRSGTRTILVNFWPAASCRPMRSMVYPRQRTKGDLQSQDPIFGSCRMKSLVGSWDAVAFGALAADKNH